jgi:hypothetical protein
MATPPTFSAGAVLTAAQMNQLGCFLVKTQAVGSGVSSVTVTDAFSADYDSYKIVFTNGNASSVSNMALTLGATATGYYGFLMYGTPTSGVLGAGTNNLSSWNYVGDTTASGATAVFELHNPFLSLRTQLSADYMGTSATAAFGSYRGLLNNSTSYTAFTLTPGAGTFTGGTIRVYGYRL